LSFCSDTYLLYFPAGTFINISVNKLKLFHRKKLGELEENIKDAIQLILEIQEDRF